MLKAPFVTAVIQRIAPLIAATVIVEPEYQYVGQITFQNGRKTLFRGASLAINSQSAAEIARDKGYAGFFLKTLGYQVPQGQTFFSEGMNRRLAVKRGLDEGFAYAKTLSFPVIVKPNDLSQGRLVAKVYNKQEFYAQARRILRATDVLKVERFYTGNDYRIVVLDDRVVAAYQRIPLQVIGDGRSTIGALVALKQQRLRAENRPAILDPDDSRISMKLRRQKLSLESVPALGVVIPLLDSANLSSGADARDLSKEIHDDFCRLAMRVARDMELRFCGVDIMTNDLTHPLNDYVIIEVNSSPSLENYALMGDEQRQSVEQTYRKILEAIEKDTTVW
jgi:D-alanine-D-alanine ligase-like ATP-grasp enzyme